MSGLPTPAQARDTIIEVTNLTRQFGRLVAIDGVTLSVGSGGIHGIIGPNGSGKTTLFNLLSGFLKPTLGEIRFAGRDITGLPPHRVARLGLVRTFQLTSVYPENTVMENVWVGLHLHRGWLADRVGTRDRGQAEEILHYMGLETVRDVAAGLLPAGTRRVLSIATALASRPKVLLLDEPLAGLNATEKNNVSDRLRRLRDRGITLMLVEHDVRSVMNLCDRITVLNFGKVLAEGDKAMIASHPKVIEAYLGHEGV